MRKPKPSASLAILDKLDGISDSQKLATKGRSVSSIFKATPVEGAQQD